MVQFSIGELNNIMIIENTNEILQTCLYVSLRPSTSKELLYSTLYLFIEGINIILGTKDLRWNSINNEVIKLIYE